MSIDLTQHRETRRKTSVSLPKELQEQARKVANEYGITLSAYIVKLLRCDLESRIAEKGKP